MSEYVCEDCGKPGIRRSTATKRCPKCQEAHRKERKALIQSRWLRKKGFEEVDMNHDPNMEDAIYCG